MREWVIETSIKFYTFLIPFSWIALIIVLLIFLPLAFWRKTRKFSGIGFIIASFLIGATTWFLGAAVSFAAFSWFGLIVGLLFFGIGVVPLGIIGAFVKLGIKDLGISMLVMSLITMVLGIVGWNLHGDR